MRVETTALPGVLLLTPRKFSDERGAFFEIWNRARYEEAGISVPFVQDNVSYSRRGVLRGMHFQNPNAQAKLVGVLRGAVYDVVADLRLGSPTFGRWQGFEVSDKTPTQLFVPVGFAHGFQALTDGVLFTYKCSSPWAQGSERSIRWDDEDLAIDWPIHPPILSDKDRSAPLLRELPEDSLFRSDPERDG